VAPLGFPAERVRHRSCGPCTTDFAADNLPTTHLVVDGSNIATEGRSLPSLQQLLDAVDAITKEFEHANVTVIVDATFGHRIDAAERPAYEDKINTGEIITPPAGVIGRGDAFILEVADRANAIVLSNDSFQEFHGTYEWLFQEGRLLGGKHVPGVGWIFLARSPVRGPTSRRAVSDAKRKRRGSKVAAAKPESKRPSSKAKPTAPKGRATKAKAKPKVDEPAGRKRGGKEPEPYNEPLPFIEFVGAHPVGSIIEAEIEQFASHGAYVMCDGTRCYISLKSISDPPPRSAREVLTLGETRQFVVKAIDTPRRGIDLVMLGMEGVEEESKAPAAVETTEPIEAAEPQEPEPVGVDAGERKLSVSQRRKLRAQQAAEAAAEAERPQEATVKKSTAKKSATKKKAAAKKATAKKATAKRATAKKAATTKAAAKKTTAKKATAKKAATTKAAAKKATARKATAKKATTKKAAAKKSPAKKAAAKKSATKKKAAAKKATAKKAPAKRAGR